MRHLQVRATIFITSKRSEYSVSFGNSADFRTHFPLSVDASHHASPRHRCFVVCFEMRTVLISRSFYFDKADEGDVKSTYLDRVTAEFEDDLDKLRTVRMSPCKLGMHAHSIDGRGRGCLCLTSGRPTFQGLPFRCSPIENLALAGHEKTLL